MEQVIKASGISFVALLLALLLKKNNPSGALLVTIGAGAALLFVFMSVISPVLRFFEELAEAASVSPALLGPLMKSLGIAVLTKFSSDACADANEKMLSTGIELVGSAAALYVSLPLLSSVLSITRSFLTP